MFHYKAIFNILGVLMLLNGLFMATTLPVSWYHGATDFNAILTSAVISANLGLLIWFITRKVKKEVAKRDGYLIVTAGWLILGLTGCMPFVLSGTIESIPAAFFETLSGYTTTGASVLNDIEATPKGVLLWRSMTQWMGGMGIIVLTVAILPIFGVGGMEMFMAEAPGPASSKLHPRITDTAKRLWIIYLLLTLVEAILLKIAGMSWYDAVNHAFTTMSTGGFSTKNASVAAFNSPAIEYIITAFMLVGGINFSMLYFIVKLKFNKVFQNEEFKTYIAVLMGVAVIIGVVLYNTEGSSIEKSFRDSIFQVVTIITTTGFSTVNYAAWSPFAYMLIILLMFTGGSAGSTAGGVKIVRHILILKNGYYEFKRLLHPRALVPVRINGKVVSQQIVYNVLAFFFIYLLSFVLGAVIISAFGYDIVTAAGASIACLGNIGPGIGGVDPSHNFSFFSDGAKVFLSFLMLIGRLELFTVLILFTPTYWKKV
jgi:trk system potassium uptake protein TrkH